MHIMSSYIVIIISIVMSCERKTIQKMSMNHLHSSEGPVADILKDQLKIKKNDSSNQIIGKIIHQI